MILPIHIITETPRAVSLIRTTTIPLANLATVRLLHHLSLRLSRAILIRGTSNKINRFTIRLTHLTNTQIVNATSTNGRRRLHSLNVRPIRCNSKVIRTIQTLTPRKISIIISLVNNILSASSILLTHGTHINSVASTGNTLDENKICRFIQPSNRSLTSLTGLVGTNSLGISLTKACPFRQTTSTCQRLRRNRIHKGLILAP